MYLSLDVVLSMLGGLREKKKIRRAPVYILNSGESVIVRNNSNTANHFWYNIQDYLVASEIDRIVLVVDMYGFYNIPFEIIKELAEKGYLSVSTTNNGINHKIVLRKIDENMHICPLTGTINPINIEPYFQSGFLYLSPDEIDVQAVDNLIEGAKKTICVNSYERNPKARKACIAHYGEKCYVCGFDFAEIYGAEYDGVIEVHHVVPLCDINSEYTVNPISDLIPLCPNCHTAIHKRVNGKYLSVEELKSRVKHI